MSSPASNSSCSNHHQLGPLQDILRRLGTRCTYNSFLYNCQNNSRASNSPGCFQHQAEALFSENGAQQIQPSDHKRQAKRTTVI